jgi:hypothetical protein
MPSVAMTAGRLTALWAVLRSLDKLGGDAAPAVLTAYSSRSALRFGALPIRDGLRLAIEGQLIRERTDRYELTDLGRAALAMGVEDEPSLEARRFFVSVLLLAEPPPWVAYWQGDPKALDLVVPEGERRTLVDSGLLPPPPMDQDLGSWAFWQALGRVPLVAETAAQRKIIGDAGEELSLAFERQRLREEGYPELALQVQWLSRESDAYGFDILSFAGRRGQVPKERLAIEVKSSSLPRAALLHFFLSTHEWETATQLGERYLVHIWTLVDPGPPAIAREGGPMVVLAADLTDHLPGATACPGRCQWQTAEIYLPSGA